MIGSAWSHDSGLLACCSIAIGSAWSHDSGSPMLLAAAPYYMQLLAGAQSVETGALKSFVYCPSLLV